MGWDPRGSGCHESTPAEPKSCQMVAPPWAGSPAGRCHLSPQWAHCLPDPKPPAWLLGPGAGGGLPRLQITDPCPLVRGQGGPRIGSCPPLGPGPLAGTAVSRREVVAGCRAGAQGPGAHLHAPSCLQPAAARAPCGTPQHGDRGLPEELPALPHGRGPPRVLPASAWPGPGHRRSLLPPRLPGPAPLSTPSLQVRHPTSPAACG